MLPLSSVLVSLVTRYVALVTSLCMLFSLLVQRAHERASHLDFCNGLSPIVLSIFATTNSRFHYIRIICVLIVTVIVTVIVYYYRFTAASIRMRITSWCTMNVRATPAHLRSTPNSARSRTDTTLSYAARGSVHSAHTTWSLLANQRASP